jgi:hypothetical protein
MKAIDVLKSNIGMRTLTEDQFVIETANFLADTTDLPANIVLWTQPQPNELPHNKYRMKVFKDRVYVATYLIGSEPQRVWQCMNPRGWLSANEEKEVKRVISKYSGLFIQLVDGKMTTDDVKYEIKRLKGEK